jgi:PKD repeat protein
MKKIILKLIIPCTFVLAQFAGVPYAAAQVIHTESFDTTLFPPPGWTVSGGGGSLWGRVLTGMDPTCSTHSGPGMARFRAFMVMPGDQEQMTTTVIDYSGASGSTPTFSLWIYRDNSSTAGDSLSVFVNTANTLTGAVHIGAVARSRFFFLPVNELANGWYNYTFNVPLSFNTDTNYILLNGTSRGGGNIFIDDLSWTEYPVACTGSFTAGGVTTSDTLICGGSGDVDLSLTGTGLAAGGLTFQWQAAPANTGPWTNFGISAITVNSGTITTATYFRCYVTCVNGSITDTSSTIFVQVSPNPAPVVTINLGQTASFCSGADPLILVAGGATTYTWSPNIAINTVGDSALAAPAFTTTYNVIGMDTTGCSGPASITVNVAQSPVVNTSFVTDTICSGQSINLNAFGGGFGVQYVWQPGNLIGQFHNVSPTVTTTYIVTATSTMTGCSGTDSSQVVVNPTPVAGFTYTVNNLTYTFTDISTGGVTSWSWNFGDGGTDNTQNPVHTYAANGNYTVTLTVSNGLCSNTYSILITVLSIHNIQLSNGSSLQVYPNPVSGKVTVEFTYDDPSVQLSVINSLGQSVISRTAYPSSGNIFKSEMDMSSFSAGIYFLQVKTKSESVFLQVVKE